MNKISQFLSFVFVFFVSALVSAQKYENAPPDPSAMAVTPGTRSSSIDMYIVYIAIIAVFFIIYYVKNRKKQLS